jgi:hypothetical protein
MNRVSTSDSTPTGAYQAALGHFDTCQQQLAQNNELLQSLVSGYRALLDVVGEQQQSIDNLRAHVGFLEEQLQYPRRNRKKSALVVSESNEDGVNNSTNNDYLPAKRQATVPIPGGASKVPRLSHHSSAVDAARQSAKKVPISQILVDFYKAGHLKGPKSNLRSALVPHLRSEKDKPEKDKLFAAMDLFEFVVSDEEWTLLCTPGQNEGDVLDTAQEVETRCMQTIRQLEENEGLKQPLANKRRAREKSYFIGLGSRVVAYRKAIGVDRLAGREEAAPASAAATLFTFFSSK